MSKEWHGGKGSATRPANMKKYEDNYDRIFGKASAVDDAAEVMSDPVIEDYTPEAFFNLKGKLKGMYDMNGSNFELAGDFMQVFGQEVLDRPTIPSFDLAALRLDLIQEEVDELKEGLAKQDIVEIADALTDILYVVYGAGHAFGIDLDECYEEVHRSNMSKLDEDGNPLYREDGKVLKGPNYNKPNLAKVIQEQIG